MRVHVAVTVNIESSIYSKYVIGSSIPIAKGNYSLFILTFSGSAAYSSIYKLVGLFLFIMSSPYHPTPATVKKKIINVIPPPMMVFY
jgi:hypothetical protein